MTPHSSHLNIRGSKPCSSNKHVHKPKWRRKLVRSSWEISVSHFCHRIFLHIFSQTFPSLELCSRRRLDSTIRTKGIGTTRNFCGEGEEQPFLSFFPRNSITTFSSFYQFPLSRECGKEEWFDGWIGYSSSFLSCSK